MFPTMLWLFSLFFCLCLSCYCSLCFLGQHGLDNVFRIYFSVLINITGRGLAQAKFPLCLLISFRFNPFALFVVFFCCCCSFFFLFYVSVIKLYGCLDRSQSLHLCLCENKLWLLIQQAFRMRMVSITARDDSAIRRFITERNSYQPATWMRIK